MLSLDTLEKPRTWPSGKQQWQEKFCFNCLKTLSRTRIQFINPLLGNGWVTEKEICAEARTERTDPHSTHAKTSHIILWYLMWILNWKGQRSVCTYGVSDTYRYIQEEQGKARLAIVAVVTYSRVLPEAEWLLKTHLPSGKHILHHLHSHSLISWCLVLSHVR